MKPSGYLTDVGGLRVGHCTDTEGLTGCTVVLCDTTMTGGVDVRGSATGTREIELLRPTHLVQHVHAILLAGGSAYGLDAAKGVMQYLEEHERGYDVRVARVPIVPAAIIMDLALGNPKARPDAAMGYRACEDALSGRFARGNVGVGAGATVGKIYGMSFAMKAGLGTACVRMHQGIKVGALVAVNAFGDVRDLEGHLLAGARNPNGTGFADTERVLKGDLAGTILGFTNTVIGVVATNARFNKEDTNKLARMACNGIVRTVSPAHTSVDGDIVFALSAAESSLSAPVSAVGSAAAEAMSLAVIDAVRSAESVEALPSARDFAAHSPES
ncbi:MAG: P1 family peptidase [Candidatus Abyssubacteria bacterium]